MTYLLALDQGTSSSRSIVFDEHGRIVAQAQLELPQIYPRPRWVEHDPLQIFTHQPPPPPPVLPPPGVGGTPPRGIPAPPTCPRGPGPPQGGPPPQPPGAPWASPTSAR